MGFLSTECPHCGGRVRKSGAFCPECGMPAPGRAVRCGRCGHDTSTGAKFCGHCGAELTRHRKATVIDNRWAREPQEFAVVLEVDDLAGVLSKSLVVEPGTRALVYRGDRYIGALDPGRHTIESLPQRIASLGRKDPTNVVLVSADEVPVELDLRDAWTADEQLVSVKAFVTVRLVEPDAFRRELVGARWRVLLDDVRVLWCEAGQPVVADIVRGETLDALCSKPGLREAVDDELRVQLDGLCARSGLDLVELRCIDFYGDAYERLRAERGEAFQLTRALEVYRRVHDELRADRIERFSSEQEFERFVRDAEHEAGLKLLLREQEIEDFKRAYRERVALEQAKREIERGAITFASELDKHKALDELRWAKRERGLELLEKIREARHRDRLRRVEVDARRIDAYQRATTEALIAILDDERADRLVELRRFQEQAKMSPEQLLALVAANSPEAALALAERYRADAAIAPAISSGLSGESVAGTPNASTPPEQLEQEHGQ
ncbi:MAG: zinc ribbon domain-containing protein [Verrucomicrobia bacterium]|nr:zinc ribbon domain-containing protein [Verrucomicrobiota bacterium]